MTEQPDSQKWCLVYQTKLNLVAREFEKKLREAQIEYKSRSFLSDSGGTDLRFFVPEKDEQRAKDLLNEWLDLASITKSLPKLSRKDIGEMQIGSKLITYILPAIIFLILYFFLNRIGELSPLISAVASIPLAIFVYYLIFWTQKQQQNKDSQKKP